MAGSGRASGPEPPPQAVPVPLAVPVLIGQPKPGLSAGTPCEGRPGGSGAAWGESEEEGEAEAAGSVGMRSDAVVQPPEEVAEAERQQLGLKSEVMMQARW